jgi:hypothetical protein
MYIDVDTIDKDTSANAAEAEIDSCPRFHSLIVTKLILMPTLLHLDARSGNDFSNGSCPKRRRPTPLPFSRRRRSRTR